MYSFLYIQAGRQKPVLILVVVSVSVLVGAHCPWLAVPVVCSCVAVDLVAFTLNPCAVVASVAFHH